jgi:hypothetical protein
MVTTLKVKKTYKKIFDILFDFVDMLKTQKKDFFFTWKFTLCKMSYFFKK